MGSPAVGRHPAQLHEIRVGNSSLSLSFGYFCCSQTVNSRVSMTVPARGRHPAYTCNSFRTAPKLLGTKHLE